MTPAEQYVNEEQDKNTRLTTHLDICRMSLQECVKQNEEYETAFNNLTHQNEQLAIELDQAKDLVRVFGNHVNRLEKALSDATQYAEEQAKVINENKQTIKNLTENYKNRLLDIQEFKEMDKSNRETIHRLIEENKGMQKTLALYAKNE